jgi:hypothetical protein
VAPDRADFVFRVPWLGSDFGFAAFPSERRPDFELPAFVSGEDDVSSSVFKFRIGLDFFAMINPSLNYRFSVARSLGKRFLEVCLANISNSNKLQL